MHLLLLLALLLPPVTLSASAGNMTGTWLNEKGDGYIEIAKVEGVFRATIVGSPNGEKDALRRDVNNEDASLKERLLLGLVIVDELVHKGDKRWEGGWIYDPEKGKTYRCRVTLNDDDTLEVRGYVGSPIFGRSQIWTRRTVAN